MPLLRRTVSTLLVLLLATGTVAVLDRATGPGPAAAAVLPSGFQEQFVFTGLNQPTNVEFSPDGRVFVAEKGGRILVFDNLADATPTVFADLSANVHNQNDRGLLGLALPPTFPADPWVYVLYTYDAPPGQTAPVWNDNCSAVGGANGGRCIVTGRLSRLQAAGNVMTGSEQVLLHDWCQQYPSHSIGDLHFGADGMLYATAGDGASYDVVDYGQLGAPPNPCADPVSEGGALRSQDIATGADPTGLNGTVLRLDPATGAAAAGNPDAADPDANARRIVADGLRNPFRFTIRPGTNEVWLGDVGWTRWEELDRLADPLAGRANFGWPCHEGAGRQGGYDSANVPICENLYTAGGVTAPYYTYDHAAKVVAGEACPSGGSSISGVQFAPNSGPYPAQYAGAAFFSDYSRDCIWAMLPSPTSGGLPDPANRITFAAGAANPVDLAIGPGGELYYVDIGGTVRRFRHYAGNQPPTATIAAGAVSGPAPLTVSFDGRGSSDPDPADQGLLRYAWDFTDDGTVDATTATASFTYPAGGPYTARLTVSDTLDATATSTVTIQSGNGAPAAVIDTPVAGFTWKAGDPITFAGHATDPQQGTLPASALSWKLLQHHCSAPDNCHIHTYQEWTGVTGATFPAPDHEYPSYLELVLTATDDGGLVGTTSRRLDPKTVQLTFTSNPPGLQLAAGATTQATPFTRTVIQGSSNSVSAVTPQTDAGGTTYTFGGWSDGGAQTHVITAPTTATTLTAAFASTTRVPRTSLTVRSFDSQETAGENGRATNAVDGNPATIWHTEWKNATAPYPHEIQLDLGTIRAVTNLFYLPRQNLTNGRIGDYQVSVSTDGTTWGTPVAAGRFANGTTEQTVAFAPKLGRYVRLVALNEVLGRAWASVAELNVGITARLPQSTTTITSVDSEETAGEDGRAINVLDGNPASIWHTQWLTASPPPPHELQLDLSGDRDVSCVHVLPRQDMPNGRIAGYEIATSTDSTTWTTAATGTWPDGTAERQACFTARTARYLRLRATAEVNGAPWTSIAELTVTAV